MSESYWPAKSQATCGSNRKKLRMAFYLEVRPVNSSQSVMIAVLPGAIIVFLFGKLVAGVARATATKVSTRRGFIGVAALPLARYGNEKRRRGGRGIDWGRWRAQTRDPAARAGQGRVLLRVRRGAEWRGQRGNIGRSGSNMKKLKASSCTNITTEGAANGVSQNAHGGRARDRLTDYK
jgi:hypothetical protein